MTDPSPSWLAGYEDGRRWLRGLPPRRETWPPADPIDWQDGFDKGRASGTPTQKGTP